MQQIELEFEQKESPYSDDRICGETQSTKQQSSSTEELPCKSQFNIDAELDTEQMQIYMKAYKSKFRKDTPSFVRTGRNYKS